MKKVIRITIQGSEIVDMVHQAIVKKGEDLVVESELDRLIDSEREYEFIIAREGL